MISDRIKNKVMEDLAKVQEGAKVRLLTIEDISSKLEEYKDIVLELNKYDIKFELECRTCFYSGGQFHVGTCFIAKFNKQGVANNIRVFRKGTEYLERINVEMEGYTPLEKRLLREKFNISTQGTIVLKK